MEADTQRKGGSGFPDVGVSVTDMPFIPFSVLLLVPQRYEKVLKENRNNYCENTGMK